MGSKQTVKYFSNDNIYLFLEGFIIALALEKWGLHKRIALYIALLIGTSPRKLVLGFLCATALLSMLISNTAATMMMILVTISASCAFMLPVATPPNAIVFGSGYVPMSKMIKGGIILNIMGTIIITLIVYFFILPVWGASIKMPSWAH